MMEAMTRSYIVIVYIALCALQISCQVSLIRNFNPEDCIIERTVVTLNCTVKDRNNGFGATVINGSHSVFNCPSDYSIEENMLYLRHSEMESAKAFCGELVSGRLMEVELNETGSSVYIAQIIINTTIDMNGGSIECRELGKNDSQQIMLANIKALPTIHVEYPSDSTFVIHWNQANESAQISHYSTNVTGEDCGNCTNLDRSVSSVINQLSCTGWEPNGQVCNVTVTAVTSTSGLSELSSLRLVFLRVPEAPQMEDLLPVYSYDLIELQSVKILLTVDSTVDPNGLPITFQVNIGRSSQTTLKCSLKISAENKCLSKNSKFRCEIDFTLRRSCPQLLSQPEQEADYQIVVFSESSIGRSSLNTISIPSYAHLMVQLLFEPQQNQEDNHFIFSFSQVYITVTSMIEYGSNCQALDNQATLLGFNVTNNVTTLTFPISGITDNICFIVTINNTFQSIAIQGNFSFETKDANQELNGIFGAGGSVLIIVIGGMITTIAFVWYIRRKRQQTKYPISVGISQSKLLSGEADQEKHNSKTFSDAHSNI